VDAPSGLFGLRPVQALLPKPLRNPKTHPELLADDPHAKTAQKQPDTAQGGHDTAKAQKRGKRLRDPEKEPF
jgi:hypothetical protein